MSRLANGANRQWCHPSDILNWRDRWIGSWVAPLLVLQIKFRLGALGLLMALGCMGFWGGLGVSRTRKSYEGATQVFANAFRQCLGDVGGTFWFGENVRNGVMSVLGSWLRMVCQG